MSQSGTYDINAVIISTEYLVGDNGLAVGPNAVGNINLLGGNNITTTGTPGTSTMTIDLTGTTQYAVQVGDATGSLDSLAVGATGEGLMGNTGANPGWTGSPSFSGTVTAGTGISITTGDLLLGNGDIALVNTDNNTDGAIIGFAKSRSGAIITTGDYLGEIGFAGWDGASLIEGAGIKVLSTGTIALDRVPAKMEFYTHPDAVAATPTKRMTISEDGNITIEAPDLGFGLTVTAGGIVITADNLELGNGDISLSNINDDAVAPFVEFIKSRAGAIITTGDGIGSIEFLGNDGTGTISGAAITAVATGTIGVNRVPAKMEFYTHQDAVVGVPTKRMTLQENGTLYIEETDAAANPGIISDNSISYVGLYQKNDTVGSQFIFRKSRGAPYTIVVTGDTLGSIQFKGADGVHSHPGASILAIARGTVGAGRVPTELIFYTHPDAVALSPTARMWINQNGNITISVPDAGVGLTINGGGLTSTGTTTLVSLGAGVMQASAAGVVSSTNGANGQVLVGGAATPTWANITSTDGSVAVTNGAGTIDLSGNGIPWVNVTGATQAMAVNTGYIANRVAGNVAFTLPAAAAVGDVLAVAGSQNGWTIAQNAGQTIHFLGTDTTTGVGGSLASTIRYNCVELVCIVANTDFVMRTSAGNITVT